MIAQLEQRSLAGGGGDSTNTTTTACTVATISPKASDTPLIIDGNLALDGTTTVGGDNDATAVSDGWMGSGSSPTPSQPDVITSAAAAAASSIATCGGVGGVSNGGILGAASSSMPRPCSSLSLADLGDLCGDQEGDDGCGGVFLVGGDCDDVNGSGIGLDLYDLGQVFYNDTQLCDLRTPIARCVGDVTVVSS